jgi:hypothetical protein
MTGQGPRKAARLVIVPVTLRQANAFVRQNHRHHPQVQAHRYSLGVCGEDSTLAGVAITGRPVSRALDDGYTAEVTRVATDGTPNACSALLGAAWRAARAMGYRRIITYTHADESGASPRAAGFRRAALLPARAGWDCPIRPRRTLGTDRVKRIRWEISSASPAAHASRADGTVGEGERR